MKYRVIITPAAEADLRSAYKYIRQRASQAARAWIKGARQKIRTLAQHPERAPLAPESTPFREPIRELFYGSGSRGEQPTRLRIWSGESPDAVNCLYSGG